MNYTLEYIFIPQILANYGDDLAFDTVGVFVIFFRKSVRLMWIDTVICAKYKNDLKIVNLRI